jgi:hypothetical protein
MIKNSSLPQSPSAPAELIEDIRKRFDELPAHLRAYVDHGLRCNSIEHVAALLWKTGYSFASSELYEYRRTLFPPGAHGRSLHCRTTGAQAAVLERRRRAKRAGRAAEAT